MMKKTDNQCCENETNKPTYDELLARTIKAEEHSFYYQTLLDETQRIARLGSWELDLKTQHLTWTKETYSIFGLEPGPENQNNYDTFNTVLNIHDRKLVSSAIKKSLRHHKLYAIDFRITRADNGKERILHSQADVIRNPADGTPSRMLGTIQDVTSQRDSLQKLEILQSAIDHASETIVITDQKANIIYTNPAFSEITGYTKEEASGQNPRILQSGETRPEVFQEMWHTLTAKKNWRGFFCNRKKNGTLYEEEVSISPLLDNAGDISHYIAVKRDVSKEKLLERQLQQAQKMEAIGTLAGGIAHDFNNILTVLIGNLELVMMFELEEDHPAIKGLNKALAAGQRAKDLANQILTFSRHKTDDLQPLKATPIIKETIKLITSSLPATIELQTVIQAPNDMILADPGPLHKILINLCNNAIKAMQNREGKLEIKLNNRNLADTSAHRYPDLKDGEYLELQVSDSGPKIAPEIADKIFDPYVTTKTGERISGLNLTSVYGIIKKLGGVISLEDDTGSGNTFTILLPTLDYHTTITDSLTKLLRLPTGCEELLLVDDEKEILELNRQVLEKLGYRISTCSDGNSALKIIKRNLQRFDLILTDMTMPGISGVDLARESLKLNPKLCFILGTGYSETINRNEALAVGIKEFYNKPLRTDSLVKMIRQVLDEGK
ncbi:MAG: hypothetical protein DRH03_03510 [Deltaproteobacteria bacterium]|nr:MAG: hypothetical protein DRH03_03510 [Deltaproteobacteria bacterium]